MTSVLNSDCGICSKRSSLLEGTVSGWVCTTKVMMMNLMMIMVMVMVIIMMVMIMIVIVLVVGTGLVSEHCLSSVGGAGQFGKKTVMMIYIL